MISSCGGEKDKIELEIDNYTIKDKQSGINLIDGDYGCLSHEFTASVYLSTLSGPISKKEIVALNTATGYQFVVAQNLGDDESFEVDFHLISTGEYELSCHVYTEKSSGGIWVLPMQTLKIVNGAEIKISTPASGAVIQDVDAVGFDVSGTFTSEQPMSNITISIYRNSDSQVVQTSTVALSGTAPNYAFMTHINAMNGGDYTLKVISNDACGMIMERGYTIVQ